MHHEEVLVSDRDEARYSDEEFSFIVQKAAELQDQPSGVLGHPSQRTSEEVSAEGLTIEEVREIASEVGLEPRFIDQAAMVLADDLAVEAPGLFGGALTQEAQGTVQHLLTDTERIELLELVRGKANPRGKVQEMSGSLEWQSVGRITRTTVSINSASESVTLRVHGDASGLAALTWLGSIGVGLAAGAGLLGALQPDSVFVAASMVGAGGVLGAGAARTIWSATTRSLRRRVQRIRDELVQSLGN